MDIDPSQLNISFGESCKFGNAVSDMPILQWQSGIPRIESFSVDKSSVMKTNCKNAVRLNLEDVCRVSRPGEANGVYVRRGTVWLTSTPAADDVILRAGDQFRFGRRWPYVIQALGEEAEICLVN